MAKVKLTRYYARGGKKAADMWPHRSGDWVHHDEAATALAEAQAAIARQQEMLDRALESNGDMMVRIGKLEGALRVAEQDFYSASNMWRDEDYEGPHEKFTVPVVCYAKPYFDMHMKHLADSAERAALAQGKGE